LNAAPERVWAALNRELCLQRPVWNSHRLPDRQGPREKEWFFDDQLLERSDRNLEHLFTLLALLLPVDAVRIAFRALHTDDDQLKATALEYLESATPAVTRQLLLPVLESGEFETNPTGRVVAVVTRASAGGDLIGARMRYPPKVVFLP
jgi:hypothetical protein